MISRSFRRTKTAVWRGMASMALALFGVFGLNPSATQARETAADPQFGQRGSASHGQTQVAQGCGCTAYTAYVASKGSAD